MTSHWVSTDLIGVVVGGIAATGIIALWVPDFPIPLEWRVVGSIAGFVIALVGYTYPVRRFLSRSDSNDVSRNHRAGPVFRRMLLAACLSGVALLGTWGSVQQAPPYASGLVQANSKVEWLTPAPSI